MNYTFENTIRKKDSTLVGDIGMSLVGDLVDPGGVGGVGDFTGPSIPDFRRYRIFRWAIVSGV